MSTPRPRGSPRPEPPTSPRPRPKPPRERRQNDARPDMIFASCTGRGAGVEEERARAVSSGPIRGHVVRGTRGRSGGRGRWGCLHGAVVHDRGRPRARCGMPTPPSHDRLHDKRRMSWPRGARLSSPMPAPPGPPPETSSCSWACPLDTRGRRIERVRASIACHTGIHAWPCDPVGSSMTPRMPMHAPMDAWSCAHGWTRIPGGIDMHTRMHARACAHPCNTLRGRMHGHPCPHPSLAGAYA